MLFKISMIHKRLPTDLTTERLQTGVHSLMGPQMHSLIERLTTNITTKRSLPRMDSHVHLNTAGIPKPLSTNLTTIRLFLRVNPLVYCKRGLRVELLLTMIATELLQQRTDQSFVMLLSCMYKHVLIKRAGEYEGLVTDRTHTIPSSCVNDSLVPFHIVWTGESLTANVAKKRFAWSVFVHVHLQGVRCGVSFQTYRTAVQLHSRVTCFVSVEVSRGGELLIAYVASISLFPRVNEHMRLQMFASAEPLVADFARILVGFLDVTLLVVFQISLAAIKSATYLATVGLLAGVQCLVVKQVLFYFELLVAYGTVVERFDCFASVSAERTLAGKNLLTAWTGNRLFCRMKTLVFFQRGLKYKGLGTYIAFE